MLRTVCLNAIRRCCLASLSTHFVRRTRLCRRRCALFAALLVISSLALLPAATAQTAYTRLADLNPGTLDSNPNEYVQLDAPGGPLVLFAATGRTGSGSIVGRELWATDGTVGGTRLVADIRGGSSSSNPEELVVFGDAVYFACTTGSTGRELCRSDGTTAGTAVLKDINPGTADASPRGLTVVGAQLFFFANDGATGLELWVSDGTANGTVLVKDIYPGPTPLNRSDDGFNISLEGRHAGTNAFFYFMANDGTTGLELWRSDGTESGTNIARDINPGTEGPDWLRQFTRAGDLLVFESYTPTTGREVWVSDGTEAGTNPIVDLVPGSGDADPVAMTTVGDEVFFFASATASSTPGLYRTEGTTVTLIESGIQAGAGDKSIASFGSDRAVLNVQGPSSSEQLWGADRNQASPLSNEIAPVFRDSEVFNDGNVTPVTINDRVFFTARTSAAGTELYTTDGTVAGTARAADFIPGADDGGIIDLFAFPSQNQILLSADDATTGIEPVAFDAGAVTLPTLPYVESFESDGQGTRYDAPGAFRNPNSGNTTDVSNDYFIRTDGSDIELGPFGEEYTYTGISGTFFWAGEDLDRSGTGRRKTLTLQEVDVSGADVARVSLRFGAAIENDPEFNLGFFEPRDSLVVRYSLDSGQTFETGLKFAFRPNPDYPSSMFNEAWAQDTNLDGFGDGLPLTPALRRFSFDLPASAQTVVVQVDAYVDGSGEEFAFDDLRIQPATIRLDAPIADQAVTASQAVLVDLAEAFVAVDGEPLSYTAASSDPSVLGVSTNNASQRLRLDGIAPGNALVTVTATSATGALSTSFAVDVAAVPLTASLDARIASAPDFCDDPADRATCDPVPLFRFGQPRADTLDVSATEAVLVTYVLTNTSSQPLTRIEVQDSELGDILGPEAPTPLATGDSVIVNRLTAARAAPGLALARAQAFVTDDLGRQANRFDTYGLQVIAPEIDLDVRIADDREVCDAGEAETDPDNCMITPFRFDQPRSDTLQTTATDRVVVRYVLRNSSRTEITPTALTDSLLFEGSDLTDLLAELETVPTIAPFDSLVVNRFVTAPAATGITLRRATARAADAGGNTDLDAAIYGFDVEGPDVRLDVRIADDREVCDAGEAETDPANCMITPFRFSQRRADTLQTAASNRAVVRYVVRNSSTTTVTPTELTDADGTDLLTGLTPAPIVPFDSLVVNRFVDAPAAPGITVRRVDARVEDAGGNEDRSGALYGFDVEGPDVRLDVRIADDREVCDAGEAETDPANCMITPFRFSQRRADTLQTDASNRAVVRYVVRNSSRTEITPTALTDEGTDLLTGLTPEPIAPFDSLVVNRFVDAPAAPGIATRRANARAEDAGGNETTDAATYGFDVAAPSLRLLVRVADDGEVCDAGEAETDPANCMITPFRAGKPRSDTLTTVGSDRVVVRYVVVNTSAGAVTPTSLTDESTDVLTGLTPEPIVPFDSLVVSRFVNAPGTTGIITRRVDARVADAGGNEAVGTKRYGFQGEGAALRLATLVGLAAEFCTNPANVATCGFERVSATRQSAPSDRQVVIYRAFNTGTEDLVSHTLRDDVTGPVFIDSTFTLAARDSVSLFRLTQDVPTLGTDRQATWTAVAGSGDVIETDAVEAPLPVEMTRFEAVVDAQHVTLQWTTASETNNAGFAVQQYIALPGAGADAGTWRTLAFMEGAGTTDDAHTYAYDVPNLAPNVHRFRLLQRDVDGTTALSEVIEVEVALDTPYRMMGPAPHPVVSTRTATVELIVREAQPVTATLYDMLGRRVALIHDGPLPANRPAALMLPVQGLSSGTYFLRIAGTQFRATKRITVMR